MKKLLPIYNRKKNIEQEAWQRYNKNRKKQWNNKSGLNGVTLQLPNNKWKALIHVNKKRYYLGLYTQIWDAYCAVLSHKNKYTVKRWHKNG